MPSIQAPAVVAAAFAVLAAGCQGTAGHGLQARPPATASRTGSTPAAPLNLHAAPAPWRLPSPVSRAVAVVRDGRIVLAGGLVPGDRSVATVTAIDPATGRRSPMPPLRLAAHDAAAATVAGADLVFGGGNTAELAAVQRLAGAAGGRGPRQPGGVVGRLPQPRSDLSAVTLGGTAYLLGGYTGTSLPGAVLATSDGRHFRAVGRLAVPVRYAATAASGGRIYLFGGLNAAGTPVGVVQSFDPANGRTRIVGHLPQPLSGAAAANLGGHLVVAGGRRADGAAANRVGVWTGTRLRPVARLPQPVANAAVAATGTRMWLLGGEAGTDLRTVQVVSLGAS